MKLPYIRLSVRTLLALVLACAVGLWAWVAFLSPVARWERAIRSDDSAHRWEAAHQVVFGQVRGLDRSEAVAILGSALADPSRRVRETAAWSLGNLPDTEARSAIPQLIASLGDPDHVVRLCAVQALGNIAGRDDANREAITPALIAALRDRAEDVRMHAGLGLALMGRGEPAVPVLEEIVRRGGDQYGLATFALGLAGVRSEATIAALRQALGSSDPRVGQAVTKALVALEKQAPNSADLGSFVKPPARQP